MHNTIPLTEVLRTQCLPELKARCAYFDIVTLRAWLKSKRIPYKSVTLNRYMTGIVKDGLVWGAGRGWYSFVSCRPAGFLRISLAAVALGVHAETQTWTGEGVPAPEPVAATITLGTYIFPGWYRAAGRGDYPYRTHDEDSEWKWAVAKQPAPRPLLGFYDDSLPEVNDWHIKWALEHGISFFAFDWYWNAGEKRLARTLEQGFLKAKYAPQMKFCIHWCNHALDWKRDGKPAPLDFSKPALLQMTAYLADHYFKLPNYLTVDGRPVFIAFVPGALVQANGGPDGFRATLEEMNKVLRAKGLQNLYFVALGDGRYAAESGFSAFSAYSYYGTDLDSEYEWKRGYSLPYADMVKHFETMWQTYSARKEPHYIVPVGSNWDDRPRARQNALVITGKTPDLFEQHCRASLAYIDPRNKLAIIEAWNEWGEGSFIEPDTEFGFAFLDRVRRVYTEAPDTHTDVIPSAAKIVSFSMLNPEERAAAKALEGQPYPVPPLAVRTTRVVADDDTLPARPPLKAWEFDAGVEGWACYQTEPLRVENGALIARAAGDDPQILAMGLNIDIGTIGAIVLRLKAPEGMRFGQGFWATDKEPALSASKSFGIGLKPDGEWHTYRITKKPEAAWCGMLRTLRFDFGTAGDTVELDWIRIYKK
ncbi:MAG TPA: glycoside hydrolase family 99-like domain-containing protein [Kiritimatiellia bacterium]|nr:glycoside hydrolase family 99-like domain-containing protein [Kiritimatiellia bacterium]OQC30509.1 MAG: hypothetical protein BWX70_01168 [Verrucomicrobia bacterium ADurb.Bin070]MDD4174589.1 glycoside hydrolase family 99-like domain-containing protein [Kiritimatiellia bacterium]MDD4441829.1 glycoside hydrolase family 99-like domain-containing protein [Kiritimatiellia bacterium]MDX9793523.1 glycoside hydrolase family 99-like domain-containing protein [Kiritimatiellia bacterium]